MSTLKVIQISSDNFGEIMQLPCVKTCSKTMSGHLRFKGTFESKASYAKESDWLIQTSPGKWRAIPDGEYQRIKDKLGK
jgi:hypothetical protein